MRLPTIQGLIDRRLLVNYRADPAAIERILPPPFRPKLHRGYAIAGICMIVVLVMQNWEIKKQGGPKQTGGSRNATLIQGLGCLLGLGGGALGVNLAGRATMTISQKFILGQSLGILNAAIAGGINLASCKAAE